jgi:pimeloyl-ACP methyl ester carboxylesterase
VHGFGISGSYLMPTARLLVAARVNIVPDLPGYGRSQRRDHTLDIPELAEAVLALLDALALPRVVLVGNSMGCPVILEVAHAAPERVDRMVLVSPAGGLQNQPSAGPWSAGSRRRPRDAADGQGGGARLPAVRAAQRPAAVPPADPVPVPRAAAARPGTRAGGAG